MTLANKKFLIEILKSLNTRNINKNQWKSLLNSLGKEFTSDEIEKIKTCIEIDENDSVSIKSNIEHKYSEIINSLSLEGAGK